MNRVKKIIISTIIGLISILGFYTTTNREQAENFALKVAERRKEGEAILNIYEIDEKEAFQKCDFVHRYNLLY